MKTPFFTLYDSFLYFKPYFKTTHFKKSNIK
jgi:hypothetical protein